MKSFTIIATCLLSRIMISQSNPIDTIFYDDHSVKAILYESDFSVTGSNLLRYFKPESKSIIGEKTTDSVFVHQPKWNLPNNISELNRKLIHIKREYFPTGIMIEERPAVTNKVNYEKIVLDRNLLCLHRNFKNDSLIDISLSYIDSVRLTNKKTIFYQKYNNGINPTSLECLIENKYYIELLFSKNGKLEKVIFKSKQSKIWDGKFIAFDIQGFVSVIGYYKNGLQDGIWNYYNENRDLVKMEKWKNGKQIR